MKRVLACLLFLAACSEVASGENSSGAAGGQTTGGKAGTSADGTDPTKPGGGAGDKANPAGGGAAKGSAPSCAQPHGGTTCGPNGNEDCCAVAKQGTFSIDKYMITAGRMRAFVDHVEGNVQGYIDSLPAGTWKDAWNDDGAVATDRESANQVLGATGKKACNQGEFTGHTYWTPKTDEDFSDFDQNTLDEKALNCVPWQMLQALCIYDGGHLATLAELKAAFTNGGSTKFPWGNDGLSTVKAPDDQQRLNIEGGFQTDPLPANFRKRDDGAPAEVSFLIAPPGRFPKGNNQAGIADSAGNLLEWVGDAPRQFIWKADFEHHGDNAQTFNGSIWWEARNNSPIGVGRGPWIWGESQLYGNAGNSGERHGYYTIGGRCAH